MAYKAFNNVPTTAFRPNYPSLEKKYYSRGKGFSIETMVRGPLHVAPTLAVKFAVSTALKNTAEFGREIVSFDTPVETGLLQSRWYAKNVTWDEWRLSNDIFYGVYNERRVQMLGDNLPAIEQHLTKELDEEIPRRLNG